MVLILNFFLRGGGWSTVSIRSFLSKFAPKRAPTVARAEKAYAQGRHADAATLYRALAERGSMQAQLRLGQLYERGEGVLQSFVEAVRWFESAAEQGSVSAMARLGEIFLTGMTPPDTATPAALVRLDERAGQESLLKRLYPQGLAVPQDPEQAAHWNSRAAHAGDAAAQARLGYQYASGFGQARNLDEAERWFTAAAKQDHSAGQLGLGMLYAGSYGERRDDATAQQWLEPCAAAGNSTAQMCLAMLLLFGEGIPRDEARAAALLLEAAKAGQPAAMFHLGELYRRGVGVAASASEAETWLRRAATRGYFKAWLSLAQLFRYGPDPDLNTAAVLCRQAADLGDGEAQYLLGQLYLAGEGVPRDAAEAARWFAKAADQNVTAAYNRPRDAVRRRLRIAAGLSGCGGLVSSCRRAGRRQCALPSGHAAVGRARCAARRARRTQVVPPGGNARQRRGELAAWHPVCLRAARAPELRACGPLVCVGWRPG